MKLFDMKTTKLQKQEIVTLISIGVFVGIAISITLSIFDDIRRNKIAQSGALMAATGLCPDIATYTPAGSLPITNAQLLKMMRRCMQNKELKDASFAPFAAVRAATRQCPGVESDLPAGSAPITRVQLGEMLTRCMQNKEIADLAEQSRILR